MAIERIRPKIFTETSVTLSPETAGGSTDGKLKVTSRVENTVEGVCPICQTALRPTFANGHRVLYCPSHNVVMPTRDNV